VQQNRQTIIRQERKPSIYGRETTKLSGICKARKHQSWCLSCLRRLYLVIVVVGAC